MADFGLEPFLLKLLIILVSGSMLAIHYLLFREYIRQEKMQRKRLRDLEKIVQIEIKRSSTLLHTNLSLAELKSKTQEKLDLIKLQLEALRAQQKK